MRIEEFSASEEDNFLLEDEENSLDDVDLADLFKSRTPTPNHEELVKEPQEHDFALVTFPLESGNNKQAYYVGKIIKIQGNDIEVSCLRKSLKCENKFIFPAVPDSSIIGRDQIVYILKPTVLSGTKRQQSSVTFEINLKNFNVR